MIPRNLYCPKHILLYCGYQFKSIYYTSLLCMNNVVELRFREFSSSRTLLSTLEAVVFEVDFSVVTTILGGQTLIRKVAWACWWATKTRSRPLIDISGSTFARARISWQNRKVMGDWLHILYRYISQRLKHQPTESDPGPARPRPVWLPVDGETQRPGGGCGVMKANYLQGSNGQKLKVGM